ncbi:RICIN domain-containing protein [Actinoplanes regularis]|uniref:Ricin-type beta-trefoil lectin domain-like n=1 Tax=Actinoplanes regularis TaxID=52697 RepID=A0A239DZ33_9ACTN|nr:RICIN domain-containing protein [Actinoplanes regularis]SNS37391.1 Ricin-type beta-trefoil lectin domain-like [Actinoplanes regularis]
MNSKSFRRTLFAIVGTGAVATTILVGPVRADATTAAPEPNRYYELRAQHSGKCLDVDGRGSGGANADLADVMQYRCWGGNNQHWKFVEAGNGYYEIRAQHSDKCLDVDGRGAGGENADFANVMQYHCWGGDNQRWRLVDVDGRGAGGESADFANVMQYHCWGGKNQHWTLSPL